jgi:hypothetical protein
MRVTRWHRLRPWQSWLPLLLALAILAALLPAGCVPVLA